MTVYTLSATYYDDTTILGVFYSLEAAEARRDEIDDGWSTSFGGKQYDIEKFTVEG